MCKYIKILTYIDFCLSSSYDIISSSFFNIEVGVYETAYHKLVNFNPTVDEMLKCIVDNRERPIIPPEWKQTQVYFFAFY